MTISAELNDHQREIAITTTSMSYRTPLPNLFHCDFTPCDYS